MNVPILAVRGLNGWYVHGRSAPNTTFSIGPYYQEEPPECLVSVDMKEVHEKCENSVGIIWRRPNLDLNLPDNNIRDLFEGCVGCPGTTNGHPWDGQEIITSSHSVGLDIYILCLEKDGGKVTRHN